MKKYVLIAVGVVILLGAAAFAVYKFVYSKPPQTQKTGYADKKADLFIEAKRLWTDYSMNEDIADPKYTGKVLEIEGKIMRVETRGSVSIVVFAYKKGDAGDEGIRVTMLPEYSQTAKGINPFKKIKIKGLCTGYNNKNVMMENGSIIGNQ